MNSSSFVSALKKYDFSFFLIATVIFVFGIINLYSATHASGSEFLANLYQVQIGYFVLSLAIGVVVSFIHPKNFYRIAYPSYFIANFLLLLVLVMGHEGMGAQRWIFIGPIRLQPSEMTKVAVVFALARWFTRHNLDKDLGLYELILPFLIALVPTVLIVVEPDLGTGLLVLLIFFMMAFYRKLKWKTIGVLLILGVLSGGIMYQYVLRDYQKARIKTFLDPSVDARGSGYNAIQSKIAIGSGKLFGKGYMKSSQASLNYLPENHTDFVFSIFNEENGFFGSFFLVGLYIILFYRFIWLANSVTKIYDSLLSIGLMALFFWHTFINMSMVTGLMPIVGLPLPLMSYGGSSLVTFGLCCGIATSISNNRNIF